MTAKKAVKVQGETLDADDKKLDNTPKKDDSPELKEVKAQDRKVEHQQKLNSDAAKAAGDKAAKAAGPVKTEKVEGYGNPAAKVTAKKPVLEPAVAKAAKKGVHVVAAGEDLLSIATTYGVSPGSLKRLNKLQTGYSNPPVGTEIKLYPEHPRGTQI